MLDLPAAQIEVCKEFGAACVPTTMTEIIGLAREVGSGQWPVNGLRHAPANDTCGWYVWAGEAFSDAADFFQPTHVDHLRARCREVLPYLGLAPGWRFLIAPNHVDVWYDASLLDV